jgi:hypothetical protein
MKERQRPRRKLARHFTREKELVGLPALAAGGFKEAAQDAVVFQSVNRTGTLDDSAHDHHGAQTTLGLVVGGRNPGAVEAGEEELLFLAPQALAKGLGAGVAQRLSTELAQFGAQGTALFFGRFGPPGLGSRRLPRLPPTFPTPLNILAELDGGGIGGAAPEQRQFLAEFFGFGSDVGQTGLAGLGVDAVVGGEGVGHQDATEMLAQEFLGRFAGGKDNMGWSGWEEFDNLTTNAKTNSREKK